MFIVLLLISGTVSAQKADPDFHLYLLAGQSNMAGRGQPDSASKQIDPQIWMLDKDNQWIPATDPVHFDKPGIAGVGLAIAFAKEMVRGNATIRIGLIPCAVGGSPIRVWEPDSAYVAVNPVILHPYDDAAKRMNIAMRSGVLKGVLWHQGESDNNPKDAPVYLGKLETLITRLRTVAHDPALPFIAGETGRFNNRTAGPINAVIGQLPRRVPNTAVAGSAGLTDKGDSIHFNTASLRLLGVRYAAAMKQVQASQHN